MTYKEKSTDALAVRIYVGAAFFGAVAGAAWGAAYGLSDQVGWFKNGLSGGAVGCASSGILTACFTFFGVYEDDPMPPLGEPENFTDPIVDGVLEFFRADPN